MAPRCRGDGYRRSSDSGYILTVGFAFVIVAAVVLGVIIALLTVTLRRNIRSSAVVNGAGAIVTTTPFTNKAIRSTTGYWVVTGSAVTFSQTASQTWSYDGQVITNDMTGQALTVASSGNGVAVATLPPVNTSRFGFLWVWTGGSTTGPLITAGSAGLRYQILIFDTGVLTLTPVPFGSPIPPAGLVTLF